MAIILGIIFPMHLIWQMNQGRHFYKYFADTSKLANADIIGGILLVVTILFGIIYIIVSIIKITKVLKNNKDKLIQH